MQCPQQRNRLQQESVLTFQSLSDIWEVLSSVVAQKFEKDGETFKTGLIDPARSSTPHGVRVQGKFQRLKGDFMEFFLLHFFHSFFYHFLLSFSQKQLHNLAFFVLFYRFIFFCSLNIIITRISLNFFFLLNNFI